MAAEGRNKCTRRVENATRSEVPIAACCGHPRFRRSPLPAMLVTAAVLACGNERSAARDSSQRAEAVATPTAGAVAEKEPTQWTLREVARRLTEGGLVVTDSGRERVRHSFLDVEGHQFKVSGSDLQVFVYPDPGSRKADSDRLDTARVAPVDMIIDWVATPHLVASGNLIAIHLTPNERLAERVKLLLEAWHTAP